MGHWVHLRNGVTAFSSSHSSTNALSLGTIPRRFILSSNIRHKIVAWEREFFYILFLLPSCTPPELWCIAAGGYNVQKPIFEISGFIWDQKHRTMLLIWSPFYFLLCTFFHWVDWIFILPNSTYISVPRVHLGFNIYITNDKPLWHLYITPCWNHSPMKSRRSDLRSSLLIMAAIQLPSLKQRLGLPFSAPLRLASPRYISCTLQVKFSCVSIRWFYRLAEE